MKRVLVGLLGLALFLFGCGPRMPVAIPDPYASPTRLPLAAPVPTVNPYRPVTPLPADVPRISPEDLWERMQAGEALVLVDVRDRSFYEQEHIVGAISVPEQELQVSIQSLPRDRLIVFYCSG